MENTSWGSKAYWSEAHTQSLGKRPYRTRYSKWYKVKPKKRNIPGKSRGLNAAIRFECKKRQCERRGELLPDEFRAAEEQTINMAHLESFPDEIKALYSNKPIHKKTPLLPLILC